MPTPASLTAAAASTASVAPPPSVETSLVWLGNWPLWVNIAVALVGLAIIGLTWWNLRKLTPAHRRWTLIGLRAAVIGILLIVLQQPALIEETRARGRNQVVVLVDQSESLSLPYGARENPSATRLGLIQTVLKSQGALWAQLAEENTLSFHAFGGSLSPPWPTAGDAEQRRLALKTAANALQASAEETHLVAALAETRARYRNQDFGAVVVLTDGIDTGPDGHRASLSHDAREVLRALDAPIHWLTLSPDRPLRDLSIADLAYNNFAFFLNATSMNATVRVDGYPAGQVTVRLSQEGQEIARQDLTLKSDQRDYPVTFQFVPKKLGKQVFTVEVMPAPDEVTTKNNRREVIINIIRDKIRVLQIVGQPSWDERFLRSHLKQNLNVDLISFFILVGAKNIRPLSSAETALIPFPARELFEEELGGFDLVVFQNFNYGPFQTRQYLPHIAKFVRDGGAFVMVGGPLSLSAGGYYGTPITDVLPVDLPPSFEPGGTTNETEFKAALTEAGRFHPVTRLALEPDANQGIWDNLEALEGVNLVVRPKADALVLAEHPTLKDASGAPHPVVAVREVEKGRTMVVTTDSTWQWSFVAGHEGGDPRHYDTFWSNAIRWLIKDPELDLVKVRALREEVPIGGQAQGTVQVFRPDYRPAVDQLLSIRVQRRLEQGEFEEIWRDDAAKTDAQGNVKFEFTVGGIGVYEIVATAALVAGRTEQGLDLFVATDQRPELRQVVPDGRLIGAIAEASGGVIASLTTPPSELEVRPPRVVKITERDVDDLWAGPWILILIGLLLSTEWWLRRRHGFL